jgi:YihY family inner membrane protein
MNETERATAKAQSEQEARVEAAKPALGAGEEAVSPELVAAPAVPVKQSGTWEQMGALGRYMMKTEVHTYAFSVAAQVILSLFPFIVLLLTLSHTVFHSAKMENVVGEMMTNFLPNNQEFVMRNMRLLVTSQAKAKIVSVIMLLITTTGVFLPLEVALNSVWGVKKNRSYLRNQMVSVGLAAGVALLAMASVALSTAQRTVLDWVFFGHTNNLLFGFAAKVFLQVVALVASVGLFFLIYWGLPNRRVPARAVLPTAVVMGVLWTAAKYLYVFVLPHLDFRSVYGPFEVSVGLMMWAFVSGLLLLAGAYVSATRQALREAREDELKA